MSPLNRVLSATSPAHANFAVAWEDTFLQMIDHIPHYATEDFDPGAGSSADAATGRIWDYFTGKTPPADFFNGEYDLKHGHRAYFDNEPAPDGECPCP